MILHITIANISTQAPSNSQWERMLEYITQEANAKGRRAHQVFKEGAPSVRRGEPSGEVWATTSPTCPNYAKCDVME
jgi:hypothetical protein